MISHTAVQIKVTVNHLVCQYSPNIRDLNFETKVWSCKSNIREVLGPSVFQPFGRSWGNPTGYQSGLLYYLDLCGSTISEVTNLRQIHMAVMSFVTKVFHFSLAITSAYRVGINSEMLCELLIFGFEFMIFSTKFQQIQGIVRSMMTARCLHGYHYYTHLFSSNIPLPIVLREQESVVPQQ